MKTSFEISVENIFDIKEQVIAIERTDLEVFATGYGTISYDPQHSKINNLKVAKAFFNKIYLGYNCIFQGNGSIAACEAAWNHKAVNPDNTIIAMPNRLDPDSLGARWVINQRQIGKHFHDLPLAAQRMLELIAAHDCRRIKVKKNGLSPINIDEIVDELQSSITYKISNFIGICNNRDLSFEEKLRSFEQELYNPTPPKFFTQTTLHSVAELAKNIKINSNIITLSTEVNSPLLVELLYLFTPAIDTIAILELPEFRGYNGKSEPIKKYSIMVQDGINHTNFIQYFKEHIEEKGWGGSNAGIIGSPMDNSSSIHLDQLIDLAQKYQK
jgi:hypothetical protein